MSKPDEMLSKEQIENKKYIIKTLNKMKIDNTDKFMKAVSNVIVEDTRRIQQLKNKQQKVIEKLEKDKKKNNEFEFMPLQIEKAYNNYYKLGKIDEIDEILEIMRGEE